jgi:hypothetical protein
LIVQDLWGWVLLVHGVDLLFASALAVRIELVEAFAMSLIFSTLKI